MIKLLDNSAVSSLGKEITCVDALKIVSDNYNVLLAPAVIQECFQFRNAVLFERVKPFSLTVQDERFVELAKTIKTINYRLGPGEIDTIAASIILSSQEIDNYIVLDERLARKIVETIHLNPQLSNIMGGPISPIKCTGTIGILAHLRKKNILAKEITKQIAYDLELSDFRVSEELLNLLR